MCDTEPLQPEPHDPSRIPYRVYSDEDIYRRELELIFKGPSWFFVALECELPEPGDFKRTVIGEFPLVVSRTKTNDIAVLENRCAHRGAAFCQKDFGHTSTFVCPYHTWSFGLDGKLLGVPFRRATADHPGMPEDFRLEDHGLTRLMVARRSCSPTPVFTASSRARTGRAGCPCRPCPATAGACSRTASPPSARPRSMRRA